MTLEISLLPGRFAIRDCIWLTNSVRLARRSRAAERRLVSEADLRYGEAVWYIERRVV